LAITQYLDHAVINEGCYVLIIKNPKNLVRRIHDNAQTQLNLFFFELVDTLMRFCQFLC